jgi:plasmid stabilization system protein ParE
VSGYVLSADADLDLDEIWDYIAADNIDAADRHQREGVTHYGVLLWPVGAKVHATSLPS